ncbi:glycosyltransferase [Rathayibacter rathayi]|uniref:glycosyltransferase n=1 Tax=Rathayibacter rathayi TaxID=33887 RepID=UPI000CE76DA0|nr:glycosyltransferase [Rathayibacter rathayi]PPF22834.1 hypothetical protein C5C34_11025 [Rathayibacter rathayi]
MSAPQEKGPRMRIMFVVTSLHGGGAEFVARTWMGWLLEQGHHVDVVTTSVKSTDEYLPEGAVLHRIGAGAGHVGKATLLKELFRRRTPDVAIAFQGYPNLVLLASAEMTARADRPKTIVSERNLVSLGIPGFSRTQKVQLALAKTLYRRADHVIAISHPVAGELIAGFGVSGERCTVVANPATAKVDRSRQVARTPGTAAGLQIVLPCRLVVQKRPELAILAAEELERRGIPAQVVSFGGGPLLASMKAEASARGVDFEDKGWVEDWFHHFDENAVVLLPSLREGFGNVLVEAAAAAVPSVAVSGALGVADAIVPGLTGELALTPSASDLADALIRASELEITGIDRWLDRFSLASSGRDLETVLRRVVGQK